MKFKNYKKYINANNPYDVPHFRSKLYKPGDRKYKLEIAEGTKFLKAIKERLGRNFDVSKIVFIKIGLLILLLVLFGRAVWLQGIKGDVYRQLADGNRIRIKKVEAKRGIIYDRNRTPLVRNVANFVLYFVPADLPSEESERDKIIEKLASITGSFDAGEVRKSLGEISPRSYEAYQPFAVTDNIEYEKAMRIYLEAANMPGVFLDTRSRREYDLPASSLAHLFGYTGKINAEEMKSHDQEYSMIDYIGKTGIEAFWEKELKGVSGKRQVEVDALGKEKRIISETTVQDGANLVLSIDATAQAKLETALKEEMAKVGQTRAVGIVQNPQNGEIIAMVSLPSFDNNVFARGIKQNEYKALLDNPDRPLYNRALSGEYPSGSTIKVVGVAAALQEGVVKEDTQILSSGGIRLNQWFFPDWKAGGHGFTNARKAIAESVNTYMYYIGGGYQDFQGLGLERLTKYYRMFGLGEKTGIDLQDESTGFVPSAEWKERVKKERWYIGDTYHIAIGQGDLVATPLQVSAFTSFFANGGKFFKPHLVHSLLTDNDKTETLVKNEVVKENLIDQHYVDVVREGMRQAVQEGSARRFLSLPVTAAAKTGTAQFSTSKQPHAWLTGFAPYDNPEVSITILIEEGEEGSRTAVGAAYTFLNWYFGERVKPATSTVDIMSGTPSSSATSSQ